MATLGVKHQPLDDRPGHTSIQSPNQSSAALAPKITLSLGSKKIAQPTNAKRPRSVLDEHDVVEQEYHQTEILQFDGSAAPAKSDIDVRIIHAQPNRDWREERRRKRQKSSLPGHEQTPSNGPAIIDHDTVNENGLGYGLVNLKGDKAFESNAAEGAATPVPLVQPLSVNKTEDEVALDALLGKEEPSTSIIAPASPPPTEDTVFRTDFDNAPPMATLEQYAAMPVEEFGAALLRGQGWKDGEAIGRQRYSASKLKERVVAKRPALLGLGAKESGLGVELGAWGKGAKMAAGKGSKRMDEVSYNPVVRRNKITGEMLTEEDFKEKLDMQKSDLARSGDDARYGSSRHDSSRPEYRSRQDSKHHSSRREYVDNETERARRHEDRKHPGGKREHNDNTPSTKYSGSSIDDRHRRQRYYDDNGRQDRKDSEYRHRDTDAGEWYESSSSRHNRKQERFVHHSDRRR